MNNTKQCNVTRSRRYPPFHVACWICGLAALFYGYEDILRVLPGTMARYLFHDLHIDAKQLGLMASMFYVGYAPMQMPAGLLLDRFGPKRCLVTAALTCTLATAVFAITPSMPLLSVSRLGIGVASSVAYLAALILAARWFHAKYFVMVVGLVQLVGALGALAGQAPVGWMLQFMTWRETTWWIAGLCLLLAMLFFVFLKDMPPGHQSDTGKVMTWRQLGRGLAVILKQTQTWAVGLFAFLVWAPISVFAVMWGISFFHASLGLNEARAGILMIAIWLGVASGGPVFGWWSNAIGRRCLPMAAGGMLGAVVSMMLVYGNWHGSWVWVVLLFLFGVASSSQAVSFGVVFDRQPQSVLGAATGFNNMTVVMGGFLFQPMVGWLLTHHAGGGHAGPVPVYVLGDFRYALWILPVSYLLSALVAVVLIKETYCQAVHRGE